MRKWWTYASAYMSLFEVLKMMAPGKPSKYLVGRQKRRKEIYKCRNKQSSPMKKPKARCQCDTSSQCHRDGLAGNGPARVHEI